MLIGLSGAKYLTGNEDEELQELNHTIESIEEDIANLRRDLAAVDSNLTSATKAEAKQRSKRHRASLDARNWIENRILALLFGISGAAYHGGKLNGVHARKFMAEADRIFAEIQAFFLSYVDRTASDEDVKEFCSSYRRLLNLLDGVFSKLRTPHGKVQDSDYVFLENSLAEVDKLWKVLNLPQTPKYHALMSHALIQFKTIGGFGDMLEDELEKSHQEALRFRSRVSRLRSMAARANAFSASEKVRNNPEVQQAIIDANDQTARKRKAGEVTLQEKRQHEKKTERTEKRVKNLAEEKDVVKGERIDPIVHLKDEYIKAARNSQE
jgi:hypothetical protein